MNGLTAFDVKELRKKDLLSIPGVVGVGVAHGSGERINVYVIEKTPEILDKIPLLVNGFPVNVIETGKIEALQLMAEEIPKALLAEREIKIRPAVPGISIGNLSISAGTFGAVARDNITGRRVILSNAHVLVPNPSLPSADEPRIVQPGVYDGGGPNDVIANLMRYIQLSTVSENNTVDAAIATPINDSSISDDIMGIGKIAGVRVPKLGEMLQKSGRTSGVTSAAILDTNADIKVSYKEFEATFTDVIVTDHMADPGDSGSATLDMNNNFVGLTFAGSYYVTAHIKAKNLMNALNISIGGAAIPPVQMGGLLLGLFALGILVSVILGKGPE